MNNVIRTGLRRLDSSLSTSRAASIVLRKLSRSRGGVTPSGLRPDAAAHAIVDYSKEELLSAFDKVEALLASDLDRFGEMLHEGWLQAWGEPGQGSCFRLTVLRHAGVMALDGKHAFVTTGPRTTNSPTSPLISAITPSNVPASVNVPTWSS